VTPYYCFLLFFVKNQLVAKQEIKLRVVHRNSERLVPSKTELCSQLQKVHQELDDIAKLIEKEVASDVHSTSIAS